MNKFAVITSSIGSNKIHPPRYTDKADHFAFVDQNELGIDDKWNRRPFFDFTVDTKFSDRRNAKIYKILPQLFVPGYEYYIWLDSTHALWDDPDAILKKHLKGHDIALFKHRRDCVYDELNVLYKRRLDTRENLRRTWDFLRTENYPRHNGLWELPARIFRNNDKLMECSLLWWELICRYTSRDQVTFPYVLSKLSIEPSVLPGRANSYNGNNTIFRQLSISHHKRCCN